MLKTIWKFVLRGNVDEQVLSMPKNAQILTVQIQRDTLCLWAVVAPDVAVENRTIITRGTGHPLPENCNLEYISTCQFFEGDLILHYFEKRPI